MELSDKELELIKAMIDDNIDEKKFYSADVIKIAEKLYWKIQDELNERESKKARNEQNKD